MSRIGLFVGCLGTLQLALGVAIHAQPLPAAVAPVQIAKGLPPETWELARADAKSRGASGARLAYPGKEPDAAIMNLSQPGLCYPEPLQDTVRDNWDKMMANFERGKAAVSNQTVVFAGLVRNAGPAVRSAYLMLSRLGRYFKDYHFILLENDSDDDTAKQLSQVAEEDDRFEFKSRRYGMSDERGLERSRLQRMADLRNRLHDEILTFVIRKPGWDLIVMYDFDLNLFGDNVVSPHGFLGVFGRPISVWDKWDMVCANSLRHDNDDASKEVGYHDCFAYRPADNEASYDGFNCGVSMGSHLFKDFRPFNVHSCFGGLAIYKAEKFLDCKYEPSEYDCEHVPFHKCMRQKGGEGRMFMDPLMTTLYSASIPQMCYKRPQTILGYKYHWKDMPGVSFPR